MAVYALKPAFRKALSPIGRGLVKSGVSADAVTVAGVVFAILGGAGIWMGRDGELWLLLVPIAALLRTAANALDGWIAQETGTGRPVGEVLNETADRMADVAMFLPVVIIDGVPTFLAAGALSAMLVASFLGIAIKAAGGRRVYSGVMGKPDRMVVLGAAAIAAILFDPGTVFTVALWLILVGCVATFAQRALIARREL